MQVWQSVSEDRDVLRKQYVKTIVPPFAALLRRWRPLLSGIHELTDSQGQSPLAVEDRPLATDVHPLEVMDYLLIWHPHLLNLWPLLRYGVPGGMPHDAVSIILLVV